MSIELKDYLQEKNRVLGVRVPEWLLNQITEEVNRQGISISKFVRLALAQALENSNTKEQEVIHNV